MSSANESNPSPSTVLNACASVRVSHEPSAVVGQDARVAKGCPVCGAEQDLVSTLDLAGQSGDASVELLGFPYRTCRQRHAKAYVYPDFGWDLHGFLFYGPGLTLTRQKRRLLGGPEVCSVCGVKVPRNAVERDHVFASEPKLGSAPPFTLNYTLPAVVCSNCGTPQVRETRLRAIDPLQACVDAFESADIRPT
jgi:hypothetical protein